ncbi:MAG TPA: PAS domain S-box protein [Rectinemataceae bacterium]|nr:PAS domain S-box protein [Rectinemataceae bacterium]
MLRYYDAARFLSVVMISFALYEFLIWLRDRSRRVALAQTTVFLLMGCYDVFVSNAYRAGGAEASIPWLRLLSATDSLVALAFLWFLSEYSSRTKTRVLSAFALVLGLFAVLQLVLPGEIAWSARHPLDFSIELPRLGIVHFVEASAGPLTVLSMLTGIPVLAYGWWLSSTLSSGGKSREARGFRTALLLSLVAVANDTAVGMGLYRFLFMTEYAWAVGLIIISYTLSSEIIENARAKTELADRLQELHDSDLELKQAQARWAAIIENVPLTVWMCDNEGRLIMQNSMDAAAVGNHLGERYDEWSGDPEQIRSFAAMNARALSGEVVHEEVSIKVGDSVRHYLDIISPASVGGELIGSVGIGIDVTEQRSAELRLRILSRAVEQSPGVVMITDTDGCIEYVNPSFETVTGYSADEVLGRNPSLLKSGRTEPEVYRKLWAALRAGQEWRGELLNRRKNGSLYWESLTISPIVTESGRVSQYLAIMQDVSARKARDAELQAMLAEKDLLLREVHHRVKNNLQVVSSLLSLNSEKIRDGDAAQVFAESQAQVRTIALVHEALYMSQNLSRIDFRGYIEDLVHGILSTQNRSNVRIQIEGEPMHIGIDKAIPAGLLVNELVTNAYKHAFADGRSGLIRIAIRSLDSGLAELSVEDDGVGLSADVDLEGASTLGLKLVSSLALQVGGQLSLGSGTGTRFTLRFRPADREEPIDN